MAFVQLTLFGDVAVERQARKTTRKARFCAKCKKSLPRKPRSVMSMDHAVETVRGILMDRLDNLCAEWLKRDGERFGLTRDEWIEFYGGLALALFPEEMGSGPEYTPSADGRMDIPPKGGGLVLRRPTTAIYAKYLDIGQQSPAANLCSGDGEPLFTQADLARLGERIGRRAGG